MEPILAPLMTEVSLALCNFIGMMWENIIHATAVDIHIFTQMLHTDTGTFNVPSRISYTPWAVPLQLLIIELGFGEPQNEVTLILLILILIYIITYAYHQFFLALTGEYVVIF